MSFRGGDRGGRGGGFRGGDRGGGRGGFGGRGGRGGGGGYSMGPPAYVVPAAQFSHVTEDNIICFVTKNDQGQLKVPLLGR
jgi:H/ACA ribonucleoprotein complex subunit 1